MNRNFKIYVKNTPVYLVNAPTENVQLSSKEEIKTLQIGQPDEIRSIFREINQFSNYPASAIFSPHHSAEVLFNSLLAHYNHEIAAGGLVVNENNDVLLIFRRGCWDLPKGKLDQGEDWDQAAKREVEEETGVRVKELGDLLHTTFYTFQRKGRDTLKETRWYLMKGGEGDLKPQVEEDIQEVRWVSKEELTPYLADSFPSLLDVAAAWQGLTNGSSGAPFRPYNSRNEI